MGLPRGGRAGAGPRSLIPQPFTAQARENSALRAAAGAAAVHIPPAVPRVLHAVAAPPTPQTPALSPRCTPVSEVRRRALEARASAEELRRQNHQLQENLTSTPPRARASALARARGSSSGSSLGTPQLRDAGRPAVTDGSSELIELAV